jgi:hypothetical protein
MYEAKIREYSKRLRKWRKGMSSIRGTSQHSGLRRRLTRVQTIEKDHPAEPTSFDQSKKLHDVRMPATLS